MSNDIDDGDICAQNSIDISSCNTMFEVKRRTKFAGGEL